MNAAEHEDATRLFGQPRDDLLDPAQRIAGVELRFGQMFAPQCVEIGELVERNHRFATCFVDQHVAGDREEIGLSSSDVGPVARAPGARQGFGYQIVHIQTRGCDAAQLRAQCSLMWQDDILEPCQT